jgi:uncharacterized MnhB-related membrane protein
MTNALKALISIAINALFGVLIAFDVLLTEAQIGSIMVAVNAILAIIVYLTAGLSPALNPGRSAITGKKAT